MPARQSGDRGARPGSGERRPSGSRRPRPGCCAMPGGTGLCSRSARCCRRARAPRASTAGNSTARRGRRCSRCRRCRRGCRSALTPTTTSRSFSFAAASGVPPPRRAAARALAQHLEVRASGRPRVGGSTCCDPRGAEGAVQRAVGAQLRQHDGARSVAPCQHDPAPRERHAGRELERGVADVLGRSGRSGRPRAPARRRPHRAASATPQSNAAAATELMAHAPSTSGAREGSGLTSRRPRRPTSTSRSPTSA